MANSEASRRVLSMSKPYARRTGKQFLLQLVDWKLCFGMLSICLIGLAVLASAGYSPESGESASMRRQAYAMGLGLMSFVIASNISIVWWRRISWPAYVFGIAALVMILFGGVVAGGARRWLELGFFRMQPSEFTKLALILVLAYIFSSSRAPKGGYNLLSLFIPLLIICPPFLLVAVQPDLGTALCHLLIGGTMLLLYGIANRTFLFLSVSGLAALFPIWEFLLHDYQRARVMTFLNPEGDPLGRGYHAMQSKIAVGSGSIFGKGFREGSQTQLRFLPEQTTDFIFSVLAEEWGFVGTLLLVLLYGYVLLRLLNVAGRQDDKFAAFVVIGIAAMVFWHAFVNIGMVSGILPVVGITLPLLSYGGSSALAMMTGLGMASGLAKRSTKMF